MRILLLGCKDYPPFKYAKDVGGIETFVQETVPKLTKFRFYLFTRRYRNAPKTETFGNMEIHRVPFIRSVLLRTFTTNTFAFLPALRLIKKKRIGLIWAIEPVAGALAYFLSKLTDIPYVYYVFSAGSHEKGDLIRKAGLKSLEKFAYSGAAKTMFVAKSFEHRFGKTYDIRNPVYIPLTVTPTRLRKSRQHDIIKSLRKHNKKIILFVGRLHTVKGIDCLIKAFSGIDNPQLTLLIVGDGPERKHLEKMVSELREKRVIFTGSKRPEEIRTILPHVDLFVLPSFSEGVPLTVLEAVAAHVPVVATSVGDIPLILNKKLLVPPGNIDELREKIIKRLNDRKTEKIKPVFITNNVLSQLEENLSDVQ